MCLVSVLFLFMRGRAVLILPRHNFRFVLNAKQDCPPVPRSSENVSAKVPVAARRPPTAAVCFLGSVRHVESRFRHFPHVPRAPLRVSGMRDGYRVSALSQCGIVKERLFTFYDQVCEEGGPNAGRKHDQGNRRRWLSGCPKISKKSRDTAGCRPGVGCLHFRRPDCSLDPPPPPPPPLVSPAGAHDGDGHPAGVRRGGRPDPREGHDLPRLLPGPGAAGQAGAHPPHHTA